MRLTITILFACGFASAQPLSLDYRAWSLDYAYQTSRNGIKVSNTGGGITFDYPSATSKKSPSTPNLAGEWAGYLHTSPAAGLSLSGNIVINGTVTVTGSPVFNFMSESFNTCPTPAASLRPWFHGTSPDGDGRWWSNPLAIPLQAGQFSLIVPMDPAYWSNTNGQFANQDASTLALFNAARASVFVLGAANGGGCFFGHGVNVSGGTATLSISTYAVNQ